MMLKIHTNFKQGIGWSFAILAVFGLFSYLTFIPSQTFASNIVDPNEHRSLSNINTMQEMSQQICINSHEEETKQLVDSRDSKKYWVTKLKDGNCWMTQNLDYDGGGTKVQNIAMWDNGDGTGHVNNDRAAYYNPDEDLPDGEHYYYVGGSQCPDNAVGFSSCIGYSFSATSNNNEHYLVGNYYTWLATVNGNADAIDPVQGICPDMWKLPTKTGDLSFETLVSAYGWRSDNYSEAALNGGRGISSDPLYFFDGGFLRNGNLQEAGNTGLYRASTLDANRWYSYNLQFYGNINPTNSGNRYDGEPIRCLAKGGWLLDDNQANVSITVSPVISIDVTKHANDMTVDFTQVARSSIIARVGSNQGYQVLISTEQSNLEQSPVVENQHIPMITTDSTITAGTSSWGISKDITIVSSTGTTISNPTISTNTIYSPIGLGENKALFYTSNTPASEDLTFPVAIAVDSTLPSGQYSTQVTLTAVAM